MQHFVMGSIYIQCLSVACNHLTQDHSLLGMRLMRMSKITWRMTRCYSHSALAQALRVMLGYAVAAATYSRSYQKQFSSPLIVNTPPHRVIHAQTPTRIISLAANQ